MNPIRNTFLILSLLLLAAPLASAQWMADFDAAKKKAAAENKALLVEFTGSDWCPPCIALQREVFSKKEFTDKASQDFVLVKVDFPKKKPLSPELQKKNEALAKKYGIQGFPTILFMTPKGRVFKQAGYQPGGVKPYLGLLESALQIKDLD
ncbi:MAG: thioredoxin family protein [Verrucomicrobiales bacterium]